MAIVKCEECGRSFNLHEDQYGKVKCKCGAILKSPDGGGSPAQPPPRRRRPERP